MNRRKFLLSMLAAPIVLKEIVKAPEGVKIVKKTAAIGWTTAMCHIISINSAGGPCTTSDLIKLNNEVISIEGTKEVPIYINGESMLAASFLALVSDVNLS